MKKILLLTIVVFVLSLFSIFYFESSHAQNSNEETAINKPQQPVYDLAKSFSDLTYTAQKKGDVPVIIGFRSDFTPEGSLTKTGKDNQRAEIRQN